MRKDKIFWALMKDTISFSDKLKLIHFILTSNRFTNGPKVVEFEKKWSAWLGVKHSLFVSSGSTANFLLIAAIKELYNLKNGDKVLLPACTWVTSVAPIIQLGLTPIFCDISLSNYCIDEKDLESIKEKHPDIKLVFTTHLLGFHSNIDQIQKIFPDAIVAEDCCESHGVLNQDNQRTSKSSQAMTFSFYYGHHMTTIEGGMISTNNSELYELMRMKRSHGFAREASKEKFNYYKDKYDSILPSFLFVTDGYNFRNTELSAVLGISQLKRLDSFIQKRKINYKKYLSLISKYPDKFHIPEDYLGISSFSLPFICKNLETFEVLKKQFDLHKIEYRPIVGGNLLNQPFLKDYSFGYEKTNYNVDLLQEFGLYVGNSQYVGDKEFEVLEKILIGLK
jgi:CDP-6-deoxy-D-xylo-4-hexulose-3-dehydrase